MKQLFLSAMVLATLSTGCVSKKKYNALADLNASNEQALTAEQARTAKLDAEMRALMTDKALLSASVDDMRMALSELEARKAESEARIAEYKDLLARFQSMIDSGKLKVKVVDGRMIVELATDILFDSGKATLSKDGKQALLDVAAVLSTLPDKKFQVEGHTDNVPISTSQYPSNWELAAARAIVVTKTLAEGGLRQDQLSAASFADSRPAASNETPEGKAANRRIEIVLVPDLSNLPGFNELEKMEVATEDTAPE